VLISIALASAAIGAALFVPPVRDRVFTTKLWPWRTPWDVTEDQIDELRALAQPGDVVVESNLHGWQWMTLCLATTGSSWVHGALVDENKRLLTVHKKAIEADWDIYLEWGSTRMALIRPPYAGAQQAQQAIDFARSKVGTIYDASFDDQSGNCNGLVASALNSAGIEVRTQNCYGKPIYPASNFFEIPGRKIMWQSR
jgi:uncharacterized protein YycO